MFPWMMPGAGLGSSLSLLSMLQGPPGQQNPFANMRGTLGPLSFWSSGSQDDRSDQTRQGNQPDTGNSMAPPGQTPQGGPDSNSMSPYDASTVSPSPAYGYQPSSLMRFLATSAPTKRPNQNQAMQMGALGLSMLQPRAPAHTGPYPWI